MSAGKGNFVAASIARPLLRPPKVMRCWDTCCMPPVHPTAPPSGCTAEWTWEFPTLHLTCQLHASQHISLHRCQECPQLRRVTQRLPRCNCACIGTASIDNGAPRKKRSHPGLPCSAARKGGCRMRKRCRSRQRGAPQVAHIGRQVILGARVWQENAWQGHLRSGV